MSLEISTNNLGDNRLTTNSRDVSASLDMTKSNCEKAKRPGSEKSRPL
jgi:hypothetical protein